VLLHSFLPSSLEFADDHAEVLAHFVKLRVAEDALRERFIIPR
jgi:hypothetical protein